MNLRKDHYRFVHSAENDENSKISGQQFNVQSEKEAENGENSKTSEQQVKVHPEKESSKIVENEGSEHQKAENGKTSPVLIVENPYYKIRRKIIKKPKRTFGPNNPRPIRQNDKYVKKA